MATGRTIPAWRADTITSEYGLTAPSMEQAQRMMLGARVEAEYAASIASWARARQSGVRSLRAWLRGTTNGNPARTRPTLPGYERLRGTALTPERIKRVKRLGDIASDLGCTLPQMALAWCLKNPNVSTVITGASRPEQVREVAPLLTDEVMARIEEVLGNRPA